jgi:hypothetical protein
MIAIARLTLLPAALFLFTSCSSTPKAPPPVGSAKLYYTKGVPGGLRVQTLKTTAEVVAIDYAKRTATLQAPDAKPFAVTVSSDAANFAQIKVGDVIVATVTQKIAVSLDDEPGSAKDPRSAGNTEVEPGVVTARITAVDPAKRTVTIQFEDGTAKTMPIREDLDISRQRVGDLVVYRIKEMTVLWIEKVR